MKNLTQFDKFDWESFAKEKRFYCVGGRDWVDYDTKAHLGTKIEVVIVVDDTEYKNTKGEAVTNRFEKLIIKVSDDIEVPVDQYVEPIGVVAKIYGDFRNQLSVTATGLKVIPKKG